MKNKFLIIILMVTFLMSCDFGDINVDPNNPSEAVVPLTLMLPSAQASLAYNLGGRASWYTGMFTAHLTGVNAQPQDFSNYNIGESDVDALWRDYYATTLTTLNTIVKKAELDGATHYAGVAKVLMANALGTITSFWGDIPYSQALNASTGNISPTYDSQQEIYAAIQDLLTDAIADLGKTSSLSLGTDDLIYGGDVDLWIKAAYALKARYFMHTFNVVGNTAAVNALSALANSFESNAEQAVFTFGETQQDAAPWYQLNQDRPDVRINAYFLNVLTALNDPRLSAFAEDTPSGYFVGPHFSSINSTTPIITFAECKFLEAEALVRTGGLGAQAAYQAAIDASITDVTGSSDAAYLTANGTLSGTPSQRLALIMTQKHIALFTQPESWTDWRRTGLPALTPVPSAVINVSNPNGQIPRRLAYPISERLFNAANIPSANPSVQTPKMWWDIN
ncbi:MAG: SusD/RagB family nutrient-binding outer membrane lipoprotein [Cytophagia bacterium]|nr:SusD/RagB family nutrient-binding outer membrane lipoprotein [Cytophagia bacterium]